MYYFGGLLTEIWRIWDYPMYVFGYTISWAMIAIWVAGMGILLWVIDRIYGGG